MVKRLFQLIEREISGLHEAAYLLGFFAILSQVLGFFRDRLLASNFGAGEALDIYYAAFRVPDLIFILSASVVSLSVLIPFLSRKREEGKAAARVFLDSVFSAFFIFILLVSFVSFLAAPGLTRLLFPGFTAEMSLATALLMRIMLLQPIFLGISNLLASITQLERRFFIYAVSPVLYNLGIIIGVFFFYPVLGLAGLAWGVVLGAILHLAIQVPVIFRTGMMPRFFLPRNLSLIKDVVLVSLPRTLALSLQHITVLVLTTLGSLLGVGSIAVFNLSWNLQSVPLSIVGVSYSLAAFPTLAGFWNKGDTKTFGVTLSAAVRHILFWSVPALVLFVVLRAQIVRTVLGSGAFDWSDTRLTAAALALFAASVVAQSISLLFTRAYYAAGKSKTPLFIALGSALITVCSALLFSRIFGEAPVVRYFVESLLRVSDLQGTDMLVLPLSYSVGAIVGALVFWVLYTRDFRKFEPEVPRTFWQSFASSVIMGFVSYLLLNVFDNVLDLHTTLGIFLQGLFAGLGGLLAGAGILYLLGNLEIREIWATFHHKIWKAKFIGPDPTETTF
ncbi:MAG: murein biosynthesis integral membrane protein MurJ [Patescibacteria group bacterium]